MTNTPQCTSGVLQSRIRNRRTKGTFLSTGYLSVLLRKNTFPPCQWNWRWWIQSDGLIRTTHQLRLVDMSPSLVILSVRALSVCLSAPAFPACPSLPVSYLPGRCTFYYYYYYYYQSHQMARRGRGGSSDRRRHRHFQYSTFIATYRCFGLFGDCNSLVRPFTRASLFAG